MGSVPIIDLTPWFDGSGREEVARQVDEALQSVGFFLVIGHGVSREERAAVRQAARQFFALSPETKQKYAVTVGGRGWLPPGVEANGYSEGTETPPDMKESFATGADQKTGDAQIDADWFLDNVWPTEIPALRATIEPYLARMRALADELLEIAAMAASQEPDFFTRHTGHSTYTMNINWYPPMGVAGTPEEGQFRIGPHTDFGTFTVLDREPGKGGLQVSNPQDEWEDAPFDPDAFTINTGDLLARWSGDRWKSNRHRVLPPQAEAPDEDLVSLVFFYEADVDTIVESLKPPIGKAQRLPTGPFRRFPAGLAGRHHGGMNQADIGWVAESGVSSNIRANDSSDSAAPVIRLRPASGSRMSAPSSSTRSTTMKWAPGRMAMYGPGRDPSVCGAAAEQASRTIRPRRPELGRHGLQSVRAGYERQLLGDLG